MVQEIKKEAESGHMILLSSVFGPYAQDDVYGSRKVNPMELYHNQVTKVQGPFSIRMFHATFGLRILQANIDAPCTVLDFPSQERFVQELKNYQYTLVGISSIAVNIGKVKRMCELIRQYLPTAKIAVGGHITNIAGLSENIDADFIVRGEGIRWFREYLGQDVSKKVRHPLVYSAFGGRCMGMPLSHKPCETAAILIPSLGCPIGCNFCSTSAMFGGRGKSIVFYDTGEALYSVICGIEEKLRVQSFFVLDENFLLYKTRTLKLLDLMEKNSKSWSFMVFSSAQVLSSYTIDHLVRLGISWVWMGLEGKESRYAKLHGIDTKQLIKTMQNHGIRVLGSSIIGLENHDHGNIKEVIDWAVSHDTDFHQFMLYTPIPGTELYEEHKNDGSLLPLNECEYADIHGQYKFNFKHKRISGGRESDYLLRAFKEDFAVNGPSIARMINTLVQGWKMYKNHPDKRIRGRYMRECGKLSTAYAAAIWAFKKWYKYDKKMQDKMSNILKELYKEFGLKTRITAPIIGSIIHFSCKRDQAQLDKGKTLEPQTLYVKNKYAADLDQKNLYKDFTDFSIAKWVTFEPDGSVEY